MAVKVQQVLEILEQIAPPELACSWDNVGLLVDAGRPVTSIMTALDITADVVRDAAESGCELIVSHHPVIFDPLRRVTAEDVPAMLLQNGHFGHLHAHQSGCRSRRCERCAGRPAAH